VVLVNEKTLGELQTFGKKKKKKGEGGLTKRRGQGLLPMTELSYRVSKVGKERKPPQAGKKKKKKVVA